MGSHRAQGPALRRSRDVPTPVAGSRSHRAPTGRAARRAAVEEAPRGYLAVVLAQPADLSAPIEPVVAIGERRARRETERLAASHRAVSPRRAAQRERAAAAPARGSSFVKVGGNLPRVGIAAALGLATIVTPVVGSMGSTADASSSTTTVATPRTVSRAATTIALAPAMAESFRVVPQSSSEAAVAPAALAAAAAALSPEQLAAMRDQAAQASRNQERAALPGCDRQAGRHRRRQRADRPRRPVRAVVGGVPAVRRRGRPGPAQRRVRHRVRPRPVHHRRLPLLQRAGHRPLAQARDWPPVPAPASTAGAWRSTCARARRAPAPRSTPGSRTTLPTSAGTTRTGPAAAAPDRTSRGTGSTSRARTTGPDRRRNPVGERAFRLVACSTAEPP